MQRLQGRRAFRTRSNGSYVFDRRGRSMVFFIGVNRGGGAGGLPVARGSMKKTMVFYRGRAPTGSKTKWKMNEYRSFEEDATPKLRSEFSLCRVYIKSDCLRSFDRWPSMTPTTTISGAKRRMVEGSSPTHEDLEPAGQQSNLLVCHLGTCQEFLHP